MGVTTLPTRDSPALCPSYLHIERGQLAQQKASNGLGRVGGVVDANLSADRKVVLHVAQGDAGDPHARLGSVLVVCRAFFLIWRLFHPRSVRVASAQIASADAARTPTPHPRAGLPWSKNAADG